MSEKKYIPQGVYLTCNKGTIPTRLRVTRQDTDLYDVPVATEGDKIPFFNIKPFGKCNSLPTICSLALIRWEKSQQGVFHGAYRLLKEDSTCRCAFGKIKIHYTRAAAMTELRAQDEQRARRKQREQEQQEQQEKEKDGGLWDDIKGVGKSALSGTVSGGQALLGAGGNLAKDAAVGTWNRVPGNEYIERGIAATPGALVTGADLAKDAAVGTWNMIPGNEHIERGIAAAPGALVTGAGLAKDAAVGTWNMVPGNEHIERGAGVVADTLGTGRDLARDTIVDGWNKIPGNEHAESLAGTVLDHVPFGDAAEASLRGLAGQSHVSLDQSGIDKIKADDDMKDFEEDILQQIGWDARLGNEDFALQISRVVQFGGDRGSLKPWESSSIDTWKVAGDELTWLLRHAHVKADVQVDTGGKVTINYRLTDTLDLRPGEGRNSAYNAATTVLGAIWHDAMGAKETTISAEWEIIENVEIDEEGEVSEAVVEDEPLKGRRPTAPEQPVVDEEGNLTEYGKWYYSRPSGYRKGVRDTVWNQAVEDSIDGQVRDEITKEVMSPDEPWDMGHRYGYEFRKHQQSAADRGIGRTQFLDEHNKPEHYRPELPSSNRSHAGEAPDDIYFGD